jgi:hypothetical protein
VEKTGYAEANCTSTDRVDSTVRALNGAVVRAKAPIASHDRHPCRVTSRSHRFHVDGVSGRQSTNLPLPPSTLPLPPKYPCRVYPARAQALTFHDASLCAGSPTHSLADPDPSDIQPPDLPLAPAPPGRGSTFRHTSTRVGSTLTRSRRSQPLRHTSTRVGSTLTRSRRSQSLQHGYGQTQHSVILWIVPAMNECTDPSVRSPFFGPFLSCEYYPIEVISDVSIERGSLPSPSRSPRPSITRARQPIPDLRSIFPSSFHLFILTSCRRSLISCDRLQFGKTNAQSAFPSQREPVRSKATDRRHSLSTVSHPSKGAHLLHRTVGLLLRFIKSKVMFVFLSPPTVSADLLFTTPISAKTTQPTSRPLVLEK